MSNIVSSLSDLQDPKHLCHSILQVPWMVVTLSGLISQLSEVYCECGQASLQRRYFADKLALIGPVGSAEGGLAEKESFLNSNTIDLVSKIQNAPAWLHPGPILLRSIQSNFPKCVREYFTKANRALSYPLAPHTSVLEGSHKVLAHCCPQCRSILPQSLAKTNLSLLVATGSDDNINLPIPLVCSL